MGIETFVMVFLFVGLIVMMSIKNRQGRRDEMLQRIAEVRLDKIRDLCKECIEGFEIHFDEKLDLTNFQQNATIFSDRLDDSEALVRAFAKDDFNWYFVLPTGAFLGEMLRIYAKGEWSLSDKGKGPILKISVGGKEVKAFPFQKIVDHVYNGGRGDIYSYLESSRDFVVPLSR